MSPRSLKATSSSTRSTQQKRMKLFSRYYFVSDTQNFFFYFYGRCRLVAGWCCCRCKNCFSHEKSAKAKRNLSSKWGIVYENCVCVHVHDVILSKQQSSQSIIKHTLCRAFPQRSFPLTRSDSTVYENENTSKKNLATLAFDKNRRRDAKKEMQGRERKLFIFLCCFYIYFYLRCNFFIEIRYCTDDDITTALHALLYSRFMRRVH